MKKLAIILFLISILSQLSSQFSVLSSTNVFAIESSSPAKLILSPIPTQATSTSSSIIDKSLEMLKQRIATSVAKIEKGVSKLNIGYITKIDKTGIEIKTKSNKLFKVSVDGTITKTYTLSGVTKKEVKFDTLAVNDYVIVSGPPLENSITANNIFVDQEYVVSSGKITEIDSAEYLLKVMTVDKDEFSINVDTSTKQLMLDIRTNFINPTGFSKLKVGDTIHFVAKKPTDPKSFAVKAQKILIIPQEYFMK